MNLKKIFFFCFAVLPLCSVNGAESWEYIKQKWNNLSPRTRQLIKYGLPVLALHGLAIYKKNQWLDPFMKSLSQDQRDYAAKKINNIWTPYQMLANKGLFWLASKFSPTVSSPGPTFFQPLEGFNKEYGAIHNEKDGKVDFYITDLDTKTKKSIALEEFPPYLKKRYENIEPGSQYGDNAQADFIF